jgi:hypothetical protein
MKLPVFQRVAAAFCQTGGSLAVFQWLESFAASFNVEAASLPLSL